MKRPIETYLDDVKLRRNLASDRELATRINISNVSITNIRRGKMTPSDDLCIRIAELAGDPIEKVLLIAAESRAPESVKPVWHELARKMGY